MGSRSLKPNRSSLENCRIVSQRTAQLSKLWSEGNGFVANELFYLDDIAAFGNLQDLGWEKREKENERIRPR